MPPLTTTWVLVRTDLSVPQQAVQAIHAGMGAADRFGEPPANHLALLSVPDKLRLERIARRLEAAGIPFHAFFEPDEDAGLTALATAPLPPSTARHFRSLPLWSPPAPS